MTLQTVRSFAKKSIEYVPGIGQMLWAMEYPFLNRSWSKDKKKIKESLQTFKDFPFPIQVQNVQVYVVYIVILSAGPAGGYIL